MKTPLQILKENFGYGSFRAEQEQIINNILAGNDTLVLMPTGGGKSVCYQVPALIFPGMTLVISPLISLMKDQVDALKTNGIRAEFLNSSLNFEEENKIIRACKNYEVKLLYMSPEKANALLHNFIPEINLSLIAIDEAHCVSQWGHDFRPEYHGLRKLREVKPNVPLVALTATADKLTRNDILNLLGLRNAQQFVSSFDRPNLSLTVKKGYSKQDKLKEIESTLLQHKKECGIIYCTSRKNTEELASTLRSSGFRAKAYHAGMHSLERSKVQEDFINDNLDVVCATIAFGMGIDKSNVRFVIHYNLPKSMESFYQEIGRGGRDGMSCETILFYSIGDLMMLKRFAEQSGQVEINSEKLNRMQEYAEAKHCRRKILLNYFNENLRDDCGNCDVCKNPPRKKDGTAIAQKVLGVLSELDTVNKKAGSYLLTDVLRGMQHREIYEKKLFEIKTYGCGKEFSAKEWAGYILQMIQLGALEIAYDEGCALKITSYGKLIGGKKAGIILVQPEVKREEVIMQPGIKNEPDGGIKILLFEKLRVLRKKIASEKARAPFIIFHDSTLHAMVEKMPQNESEMLAIPGVSVNKMNDFGYRFLEIIRTGMMVI